MEAAGRSSGASVRSLIDRFRNAPPMSREERAKGRGGGGGGSSEPEAWWRSVVVSDAATDAKLTRTLDAVESVASAATAAAAAATAVAASAAMSSPGRGGGMYSSMMMAPPPLAATQAPPPSWAGGPQISPRGGGGDGLYATSASALPPRPAQRWATVHDTAPTYLAHPPPPNPYVGCMHCVRYCTNLPPNQHHTHLYAQGRHH